MAAKRRRALSGNQHASALRKDGGREIVWRREVVCEEESGMDKEGRRRFSSSETEKGNKLTTPSRV